VPTRKKGIRRDKTRQGGSHERQDILVLPLIYFFFRQNWRQEKVGDKKSVLVAVAGFAVKPETCCTSLEKLFSCTLSFISNPKHPVAIGITQNEVQI
jgi:hypothetical protein